MNKEKIPTILALNVMLGEDYIPTESLWSTFFGDEKMPVTTNTIYHNECEEAVDIWQMKRRIREKAIQIIVDRIDHKETI